MPVGMPQGLQPRNTLGSSPAAQPRRKVPLRYATTDEQSDSVSLSDKLLAPGVSATREAERTGRRGKSRGYTLGKQSTSPRRSVRSGSENEEDVLAQNPSKTHQNGPFRRRPTQKPQNEVKTALDRELPPSFNRLDRLMSTDDYAEYRKNMGQDVPIIGRRSGRNMDYPTSIVETASFGLTTKTRDRNSHNAGTSKAIVVADSQPSDNSQPQKRPKHRPIRTDHADTSRHTSAGNQTHTHSTSRAKQPQVERRSKPNQSYELPVSLIAVGSQIYEDADKVQLVVDMDTKCLHFLVNDEEIFKSLSISQASKVSQSPPGNGNQMRITASKSIQIKDTQANCCHIICKRAEDFKLLCDMLGAWSGRSQEADDAWLSKCLERQVSTTLEIKEGASLSTGKAQRLKSAPNVQIERPSSRSSRACVKMADRLQDASGFPTTSPAHGDAKDHQDRTISTSRVHQRTTKPDIRHSDFHQPHGPASRTRQTSNRQMSSRSTIELDPETEVASAGTVAPVVRKDDIGPRWKKPLTFPREGKHKATVVFEDLERLEEYRFLNDSIIQFYLRYLQYGIEKENPEAAKRVYWFNTYFFSSLTTGARGRTNLNFDAVKRWTKQVDLFGYDYIVVPINEANHWYVAIICNLPALLRGEARSSDLDESRGDGPVATSAGGDEMKLVEHGGDSGANDSVERDQDVQFVSESATNSPWRVEPEVVPFRDDTSIIASQTLHGQHIHSTSEPFPAQHIALKDAYDQDEVMLLEGESVESPQGTTLRPKTSPGPIVSVDDSQLQVQQSSRRSHDKKRRPPVRTYDPAVPAIITLDSVGQPHASAVRALKMYLVDEAKDKKGSSPFVEGDLKGITAKGIPLQQNFWDCGLYLLGYMDKFVEGPQDFVTKLLRKEFDQDTDWPRFNPSELRKYLRDMLQDLHHNDMMNRKQKSSLRVSDSAAPAPMQQTNTEKSAINSFTAATQGTDPRERNKPTTTASVPTTPLEPSLAVRNGPLTTTTMHPVQRAPGGESSRLVDGDEMILDSQEEAPAFGADPPQKLSGHDTQQSASSSGFMEQLHAASNREPDAMDQDQDSLVI